MSASILVVDDEPDVAELFRQRFRRETRQGTYVVHYAASGQEALDRLSGEIQPALLAVLSVINMPGMDGLQLLAEIKQRRPDLTVMMVTAYGDDARRQQHVLYRRIYRRTCRSGRVSALHTRHDPYRSFVYMVGQILGRVEHPREALRICARSRITLAISRTGNFVPGPLVISSDRLLYLCAADDEEAPTLHVPTGRG